MKWTLKVRNGKEKYHCIEFTGTEKNIDKMNNVVNAVVDAGGNVTIDMRPDTEYEKAVDKSELIAEFEEAKKGIIEATKEEQTEAE